MFLSEIYKILNQKYPQGTQDIKINSICNDSRKLERACIFVAVRGSAADGHHYIKQAIEAGAAALVVEDESSIPANYGGAKFIVKESRAALSLIARHFYSNPALDLYCLAVTGTNGKTSTVYMLEHLFNDLGWPTAVMGTIDHHLGDKLWPSRLTTPDVIELHQSLQKFVKAGAKAVALEASSHAIDQKRVEDIPFDVFIFTNLTRDHLDYHKSMEDYFKSKQRLFSELPKQKKSSQLRAIINIDDSYGKRLKLSPLLSSVTIGQSQDADFSFSDFDCQFEGTSFHLKTPQGEVAVRLSIPGVYNVYNAVGAMAAAMHAGLDLAATVKSIESFKGVPGRLQMVENDKGVHIFIDYAHTDKALESSLNSLIEVKKKTNPDAKIITVFGCGGDRDKGKRPLMGAVAEKLSDEIIITSDNPRGEDPTMIIADIKRGLSGNLAQVLTEVDRRSAIKTALGQAQSGDVVLIAGKGHEDYQIIGDQELTFSDYDIAKELIDGLSFKHK